MVPAPNPQRSTASEVVLGPRPTTGDEMIAAARRANGGVAADLQAVRHRNPPRALSAPEATTAFRLNELQTTVAWLEAMVRLLLEQAQDQPA